MRTTLFTRRPVAVLLITAVLLAACGTNTAAPAPTAAPVAPTAVPAAEVLTSVPTVAATLVPNAAPTIVVPTTPAAEPIAVVATFSIIGEFAEQVGGERVAVTTLVGPGGDAHTFEPAPADAAKLVDAKVILQNGLAFETWMEDLYPASGATAPLVSVSDGITTIAPAEEAHGAGEVPAADEAHGEEHGESDPHVWHDVQNAVIMVENVRAALTTADPAGAEVYAANAKAYTAELEELDAFVVRETARIAAERRLLVTSHDTFGYFAARYGYTLVGTALGAVSTEAGDPAAGEIAALVKEIQAAKVPTIFAENVSNPALIETLAREAGVQIGAPLYTDALGEAGSAGATYITMIRSNVAALVAGLAA